MRKRLRHLRDLPERTAGGAWDPNSMQKISHRWSRSNLCMRINMCHLKKLPAEQQAPAPAECVLAHPAA